jgi:hypothetical protein
MSFRLLPDQGLKTADQCLDQHFSIPVWLGLIREKLFFSVD